MKQEKLIWTTFRFAFMLLFCIAIALVCAFVIVRYGLNIPPEIGVLPKTKPDEQFRKISSNKCFSIVAPESWNVDINSRVDMVRFDSANRESSIKQNFSIVVVMEGSFEKSDVQFKIESFLKGQENDVNKLNFAGDGKDISVDIFQGHRALKIVERSHWLVDDTTANYCTLFFVRDDVLFSIYYSTNTSVSSMPPKEIMEYLNTFKKEI